MEAVADSVQMLTKAREKRNMNSAQFVLVFCCCCWFGLGFFKQVEVFCVEDFSP